MKKLILALILGFTSVSVIAQTCHPPRSASARAAFKRSNPCPATGKRYGACPGYVIDHVIPLCACGLDAPQNMQWQTTKDSYIKDAEERRQCASLRAQAKS